MSAAIKRFTNILGVFVAAGMIMAATDAGATIDGILNVPATPITLTAKQDFVSMPDGGSPMIWGYTTGARAQYPGPTLIVNQGDEVVIELINDLSVPTSIIFPGQNDVVASGGVAGIITQEAPPDGTTVVTYTFTATDPGTYMFQSGTQPELQVEMGLFGALIVRPAMGDTFAYNHADSAFDEEHLFLFSAMDPYVHFVVETSGVAALAATDMLANYFPNYWFLNGRAAPDTLAPAGAGAPWLPTQPYNALVMTHPGDKVLMRYINAGRDPSPFHPHGNHARVIARDGRLLESAPGAGADLSHEVFTIDSIPGQTLDAIWTWTGEQLGWDIYGTPDDGPEFVHTCVDGPDADDLDDITSEYCPDHYKPIPVALPDNLDLAFGGLWSGSPFLGSLGQLPPGEGGLNPWGGYAHIWHSHTEKEITNFDIFPGGILTFVIVQPLAVPIAGDTKHP